MNKQELHIEALLDKAVDKHKQVKHLEFKCEHLTEELKEANATIAELEEKLSTRAGNNKFDAAMDTMIVQTQPPFKFQKGDKVRYVGGDPFKAGVHEVTSCAWHISGQVSVAVRVSNINEIRCIFESCLELIEESK